MYHLLRRKRTIANVHDRLVDQTLSLSWLYVCGSVVYAALFLSMFQMYQILRRKRTVVFVHNSSTNQVLLLIMFLCVWICGVCESETGKKQDGKRPRRK